MKAIVYERWGGPEVLEVRDVPVPEPRSGAVRVHVRAAALNPKDVLIRKGKMRWLTRELPRTPGYDLAGTLLDPWADWPAGTAVFGMIQDNRGGACAQVVRMDPDEIARAPGGLTPIEAAALPLAALTALQALRDELGVEPGQRVLLNGASGGVGTVAVQIARALGCEVIASCSPRNTDRVKALGANQVYDYANPGAYPEVDAVFDIFGSLPWKKARPLIRKRGRFCTTIPKRGAVVRGALARLGLHRAHLVVVRSRRADLEQLASWVESGALRPIVDEVVSWRASAEGHHHIETRRAKGKVVVDFSDAPELG